MFKMLFYYSGILLPSDLANAVVTLQPLAWCRGFQAGVGLGTIPCYSGILE